MQRFSKFISCLFHPVLIPLYGTVAYFIITPKFNSPAVIRATILSVLILTGIIPVAFYFLFRNLGKVRSPEIKSTSERKLLIYLHILLYYIVILRVIPTPACIELYYFFVGIIGSYIACLVLVYFKFKASIHLMNLSTLSMFIIALAFHYEINITVAIAVLVLALGALGSSRLYLKVHNGREILVGSIIGFITLLITLGNWL